MGKKSKKEAIKVPNHDTNLPFLAESTKLDPSLTTLFSSSFGPVQARKASEPVQKPLKAARDTSDDVGADEDLSSLDSDENGSLSSSDEDEELSKASSSADTSSEDEESTSQDDEEFYITVLPESKPEQSVRNRKRKAQEEDIEDVYMRQMALKEAKEDKKRKETAIQKRRKVDDGPSAVAENVVGLAVTSDDESQQSASCSDEESGDAPSPIPQHETLAPSQSDIELEKSSRTVFLGNVSSVAITSKSSKKALLNHLASFLSSLPASMPPHKVESIRFRSTAYASAIPKKAAFTKRELLDATTKSTNAYAVYSTQLAAREAAKRLNGTVILDRYLRVDEVAHPAKTDHKRCVFVGNLGFVDDESALQAAAEEKGKPKQKKREPADVEEGLWREFGKCGAVESVRVVRDSKTRVGKGIAYVQFKDENAVEAALLYNDKKFPPLLPRKLRVIRAKPVKRNKSTPRAPASSKAGIYNPKADPKKQSMQGRASKLLGKAGAAQARTGANSSTSDSFKSMESFVFEGFRATASQGKNGFKFGGKANRRGKPATHGSNRAATWKSAGGKKSK